MESEARKGCRSFPAGFFKSRKQSRNCRMFQTKSRWSVCVGKQMLCASGGILFEGRSAGICSVCTLLPCPASSLVQLGSGAGTTPTSRALVPPSPESSDCFRLQLHLFHLVLREGSPPAPAVSCWVSAGAASRTAAVQFLLVSWRV